ncbi:MAG: hypothetical protein ACLP22_11850 [Solirubrobacteraceae bacterium]
MVVAGGVLVVGVGVGVVEVGVVEVAAEILEVGWDSPLPPDPGLRRAAPAAIPADAATQKPASAAKLISST